MISEKNEIDTLRLSAQVGYSIAGELGTRVFEALELALVTKLFPKRFSNVSTLRTRQHILLYWHRGFLKTTLLREFSKTIPDQFKVLHLSSATTEILCGSIHIPRTPFQQPRIVPPAFAGADFAIITEHSAFLKQGGSMSAKLSILNDILEGDRVSNTLVILGQVQIDPTQKAELEKLNVTYDPSEATISYEPDVLFLSASHPFDEKTLALLVGSGHLDRFCVIQKKITTEIAQQCFRNNYALDKNLQQKLKHSNERLCRSRIESIDAAPHDLLRTVYERLFTIAEIPDFRVKGDIIRAVAAHMVLRFFNQGKSKTVYSVQDYTQADIDFVSERLQDFVEPRISPLVLEGYSRIGRGRKRDRVKHHIRMLLKASEHKGRIGEPLRTIVAYVQRNMQSVHFQTINNAKDDLINEHKIEKVTGMHGYYRLAKLNGGS